MADSQDQETSTLPDWGTFNQICQAIVRRAKQEIEPYNEIISHIETSKSCEDITKYLVKQNEVVTYVNTLLNQMQTVSESKSNEVARETITIANGALSSGHLEKAANLFTKSLMKSVENSEEYLQSLINRSDVLQKLGAYKDCLLDTHIVLISPASSPDIKCLMYRRRIECLRRMGLHHEADTEGEKAVSFASSVNDNGKMLIQMQKCILDSANIDQDERMEKKPINIDTRVKCLSSFIEGASSKVDVATDAHKGRCFIAKEDIEASEVLLHETAFVTWLEPKYYQEYCLHCLTYIKNKHSVPCTRCTHALFCSFLCRDASNKEYHERECVHLLLLVRVSRVHAAVRMILKVGIDNALNWDKNRHSSGYKFASDYSIIRTYIDHLTEINGNIRMGFALVSLMVARLIFSSDHRIDQIAALIMRHSLQVWCNALSIEHDADGSTKFLQCNTRFGAKIIGIGVYPIVTLLNHACEKKTYVIFRSKSVTIKSVGEFKAGEEITFNYGPWDKKMSLKDRQECLKSNFMFTCTCSSCASGRECIEESYSCYECDGPAVINHSDATSKCTSCGKRDVIHIEQIELVRKKIRPLLRESATLIQSGSLDQAVDIVKNLERNLTGLFHPMSNTMISMRENLANLLEKQRKWEESADLRAICLAQSIEQSRGATHFNHLYFNMKICKMLIKQIESDNNFTNLPRAIEYFTSATDLLKEVASREALILEAPPEIVSCLPELKDIKETLAKFTRQLNKR